MVACLKRLLPVGLNLFGGREQELVQHAKEKFLKRKQDSVIFDYVKTQLTLPDKIDPSDDMSWQHYLYSKLGSKKPVLGNELSVVDKHSKDPHLAADQLVERIIEMAKVLYGLHMVIISVLLFCPLFCNFCRLMSECCGQPFVCLYYVLRCLMSCVLR